MLWLKDNGELPTSFVTLALKKLYKGQSAVEEEDIKHTSATTYAGTRQVTDGILD